MVQINRYWVGDSGFTTQTGHWSASSGGASGESAPTAADDVIIDVNSFTTNGQELIINHDTFECKSFTYSGVLYSPVIQDTSDQIISYGNFVCDAVQYFNKLKVEKDADISVTCADGVSFNELHLNAGAYHNATVTGDLTISKLITRHTTYNVFENSSTQTIDAIESYHGSNSAIKTTIRSVTAGTYFTITKTIGNLTFYGHSIKDCHATGGAEFNAINCTSVSGNTGIDFFGQDWIQVAPALSGQAIVSICDLSGVLYGVTGDGNGALYKFNGIDAWVQVAAQLNSQAYLRNICVFNGKIYAGTGTGGRLFEFNGTNAWVQVAPQYGSETQVQNVCVFNSELYGGSYPNGLLLKWNGTDTWEEMAGKLNSQTLINVLRVFNGKLYGGTYPNAKLFEWNDSDAWVEVAPNSSGTNIIALEVYDNKLYAVNENYHFFEWNGIDAWVDYYRSYNPNNPLALCPTSLALYATTVSGCLLKWDPLRLVFDEIYRVFNSQNNLVDLIEFAGELYAPTGTGGRLFKSTDLISPYTDWVQVATQLNSQTIILSTAVLNGKVYGGTASNGKLFEWNGTDAWVEVAPQYDSQIYITSLAVLNGKIYGGTYAGGRLLEWNGTDAWIEVAPQSGSEVYITSLCVYNGKIYAGTNPNGKLLEWNGSNAWVEKAPKLNSQTYILSMCVYNSKLYAGTNPGGRLFEWNDVDAWVQVAPQLNSQASIYFLAVYNNKLYGGTGNGGRLFEWNDVDAWVQVAPQFNSEAIILSMCVYDSKLYAGTSGLGKLFKWNGTDAWVEVAGQKNGQVSIYGLTVLNSKLYAGTGNYGRLFEWTPPADIFTWMTPIYTRTQYYLKYYNVDDINRVINNSNYLVEYAALKYIFITLSACPDVTTKDLPTYALMNLLEHNINLILTGVAGGVEPSFWTTLNENWSDTNDIFTYQYANGMELNQTLLKILIEQL